MANAEKPFFIETELVRVEVMGTRFNVECDDHSSFSLSVKSGEVKTVLKKNNQIVHVKAGESVFLAYSGLQKTAGSNSNIFDSYLNNLHFKDERLENVTKIISELSDSVQLYTSPEVANRLITITLTDSSPITMAELICQALDLSLKQNGNVFTISKKS